MSDFLHHPWLHKRQTKPWRVTDELAGTWYRVRGNDGLPVSALLTRSNADLVAAAPEMMDALVQLRELGYHGMKEEGLPEWNTAMAALKKAEGRDD